MRNKKETSEVSALQSLSLCGKPIITLLQRFNTVAQSKETKLPCITKQFCNKVCYKLADWSSICLTL